MDKPTDKQLEAIRNIERNLPYIKFAGSTKRDAHMFIQENLERSKEVYRKRRVLRPRYSSHSNSLYSRGENERRSDRERYDEYIEKISGAYSSACFGDDWGGFESREIARKLHSFDDWKAAGEP